MTKLQISPLFLLCTLITLTLVLGVTHEPRNLQQTQTQIETENDLRAKIDAKIQARIAAVTEYDTIYARVKSLKGQLDAVLPQLLDAQMIAQNYYQFYYNTHLKCRGYFPDLEIIGVNQQIPVDSCTVYPLDLQTYDLVTHRAQLQGYIENTKASSFAVYTQTRYITDANKELYIYQYLAGQFSQRGNTTLRDKYVSKSNSFSSFITQQNQKLEIKLQVQTADVNIDNQYAQIAKKSYQDNEAKAISCFANLANIKTDTLSKYDEAKDLESQVEYKKSTLAINLENLANKNTQIQGITAELKVLVDQYVALF